MSESRRLPNHLEEFVLWQERKLQDEQESEIGNVIVRKVTLRIGINHYIALRMLARRYGVSVTAIGEKLLEMAALDAADLAGISGEALMAEVEAELAPLDEKGHVRSLTEALAEHDLSLAPLSMDRIAMEVE